MIVTFKANSRLGKYRPGKVYHEELTPLLKAILLKDDHLQLIDPPTLDPPAPAPAPVAAPPAPATAPAKEEKLDGSTQVRDQGSAKESGPAPRPSDANRTPAPSPERS